MTDLNTPVEIDTAISEQLFKLAKAEQAVNAQEGYLSEPEDSYRRCFYDESEHAAALEAFDRESAEDKRLQALYTGWPRYWHVTNNNGHVHTSQSCTSCFPDTQYAWRTDLSGLTPEQVVEREAYNACSVCMPIAPAEQREARKRYTAEQKAQRQAEKNMVKAEKLRKAAVRAQKLVAKVDAWYEANGGREAVLTSYTGSQIYNAQFVDKLQTTVWDVIYDDWHERHEIRYRRLVKDPRKVIEQAKDQGLI